MRFKKRLGGVVLFPSVAAVAFLVLFPAALCAYDVSDDGNGSMSDAGGSEGGSYALFEDYVWNQWQPFNDFAPVFDPAPSIENDAGYRGRSPAGCVAVSVAELFAHHAWPSRVGPCSSFVHDFYPDDSGVTNHVELRFDGSAPFRWDALFQVEPIDDIWNGARWVPPDDLEYGDYNYWVWDDVAKKWIESEDWIRGYYFYYYDLQSSSDVSNDLRGYVEESFRYEPARVCLWTMSLAETTFWASFSGGDSWRVAFRASEWYEPGRRAVFDEEGNLSSSDKAALESQLLAGMPALVVLPGADAYTPQHLALICGWDSTRGAVPHVYLNFGWSWYSWGETYNDNGWYALGEDFSPVYSSENQYRFESILLGHFPRARPQLDPMRAVIDGTETLSWAFPWIHTNAVLNWRATRRTFDQSLASKMERFDGSATATTGAASGATTSTSSAAVRIVGEGASICDSDGFLSLSSDHGNALRFSSASNVVCELPWVAVLSTQSELSLNARFFWALSNRFSVEAKFGDGAWETILQPVFNGNSGNAWEPFSIPLGGHAGESVQFRFVNQFVDGQSFYPGTAIWIDDIVLSNAYFPDDALTVTVPVTAAADRSLPLSAFGAPPAGRRVAFSVEPVYKSGVHAFADAEPSRPVVARVCDTATPALALPKILSVSTVVGTPLQETFYREAARAKNALFVECSESVVSLEARSSNLTVLPDSAVAVTPLGFGEFAVELDASAVPASSDRTRLILTLSATDANGSRAVRDLVLRLSGETPDRSWAVDFPIGGGDPTGSSSGSGASIAVPRMWLVRNGLSNPDDAEASFSAAAAADPDGDRVPNAVEWACHTDPFDETEGFHADIAIVGGEPRVSVYFSTLRPGYETVLQGRESLAADDDWEVADVTRHCFFRAVIRASGNGTAPSPTPGSTTSP